MLPRWPGLANQMQASGLCYSAFIDGGASEQCLEPLKQVCKKQPDPFKPATAGIDIYKRIYGKRVHVA